MFIKEIHIYGYGKLENVTIANLERLTVFLGENEAGKSTIMAFIHSILFGFPTRKQTEPRYEPKFHSKYGGMLMVEFPDIGMVTVERVKGKAVGDVTVTLPDGTIGDESLLTKLLRQMDLHTFRSIYSFNIHGIQHAQQMSNDDLNKFLFSSGTIGTDRLMKAENVLQKELDERFRPRGKKPKLNVLLTELREADRQLKSARQNNDHYFSLLNKKETLVDELEQIREQIGRHNDQLRLLQEWKELHPLLTELEQIKQERSKNEQVVFPTEGKNRMDTFQEMLIPYQAQIAGKEERLNNVKKELADGKSTYPFLQKEQEIAIATESLSLYETMKLEEGSLREQMSHLTERIEQTSGQLHLNLTEEGWASVPTDVATKEKVAAMDRDVRRLTDRKTELDERFNEAKAQLDLVEKEIAILHQALLSEEEREILIEQRTKAEKRHFLEQEINHLNDRLSHVSTMQRNEKEKNQEAVKQRRVQTLLSILVFVLLSLVSFINEQIFVGAVALIGLILFLFVNKNKQVHVSETSVQTKMATLKEKKQTLAEELDKIKHLDTGLIEQKLAHDRNLQEQHRYLLLKLEEREKDYDAVISQFEKWELESNKVEQTIASLISSWEISKQLPKSHLLFIFESIVQLKEWNRERTKVQEQLQQLLETRTDIETRFSQLATSCGLTDTSIYQIATGLKQGLKRETEDQVARKGKKLKQKELEEEIQQLKTEQNRLIKEVDELLQQARATSLEEFYETAEQWAYELDQVKRQKELERIINKRTVDAITTYFPDVSSDGKREIQAVTEQMTGLQRRMEDVQASIAEVEHQITLLEEGGIYADILHQFKQKEADFHEEGKVWARFALAKTLLLKTIAYYKKERLPKVLLKATRYLQRLTNGEYIDLRLNDQSAGLLIERKDHALFLPEELSQATAEQVYVALRFALATSRGKQSHTYPIIIDDSFVNFDSQRMEQMIQLLHEISKEHQVIYFTCHQHVVSQFHRKSVFPLSMDGSMH